MRFRNIFLVAFPLTVLPSATPGQRSAEGPRRSVAEIARAATPATVTVVAIAPTGDTIATGSGYIARGDGAIITCWHVLRGATRALVVLSTGERYDRVAVLDADSALDVAVLKIPGYALPFLIARSSVPASGEEAIAIGSPLGLSRTVSTGIVSASRVVNGRDLVQVTTPISPGSSGGPILDAEGHVFAIVDMYLNGGQQLNFALPVRYAMGLLNDARVSHSIAETFGQSATPFASLVPDSENQSRAPTGVALPGRTLAPLSSMARTYVVSQTVTSGRNIGAEEIGMLIATHYGGWLTLVDVANDSVTSPVSVYYVSDLRTNTRGDVALLSAGVAYDGYQIDSAGFLVSGEIQDTIGGQPQTVRMKGVAVAVPLTAPTGIYEASVRTTYTVPNAVPSSLEWRGLAAATVIRDSIYVTLHLTNDRGGSSALTSLGPISADSSFDLRSVPNDGGYRELRGRLRAGVIVADWIDTRSGGGKFEGTLRATRQWC